MSRKPFIIIYHDHIAMSVTAAAAKSLQSCLCATPEKAAHQAPPSLGFSRQDIVFVFFFNGFIEILFTHHIIHPFKLYNSMVVGFFCVCVVYLEL